MSATRTTGPELAELRAKYVPRGITSSHPIVVDHAKGSELWDTDGRRYTRSCSTRRGNGSL